MADDSKVLAEIYALKLMVQRLLDFAEAETLTAETNHVLLNERMDRLGDLVLAGQSRPMAALNEMEKR